MRRREFITLLGSAAAAWPVVARAQQGERMRRIGLLMNGSPRDAEQQDLVAVLAQISAIGLDRGPQFPD
jgi:putative tryptophan/tyrosine transport system substrate-binding protein